MKKLYLLLMLPAMFLLTGCFDVIEEITLNKDGSGIYSLAFDMSALMSDDMMKGMLKQAMENDENIKNELEKKDMEVDTVMNFKDSPMAEKLDEFPKFMEKATMHTQMSDKEAKMVTTIKVPFNNVDQISEFFKVMAKAEGDGGQGPGAMLGGGGMPFSGEQLFALSGRTLKRLPAKVEKPAEEDESMQMMKMFMAGATYKVIYNLPGKVKSTTIKDAEVSGKKVVIKKPLLQVSDGTSKLDGEIKFKKK